MSDLFMGDLGAFNKALEDNTPYNHEFYTKNKACLLNFVSYYESCKPSDQPDDYSGLMDRCYSAFGIGKHARNERTLLVNIENAARRSSCLSFIEGFLELVVPDEDDDCPLNWGDSPEAYLEKFKAVWNARANVRESGAPYLHNRADGVDGHYCIARYNPKGFTEFYEAGKWVSATSLIFHLGKSKQIEGGN